MTNKFSYLVVVLLIISIFGLGYLSGKGSENQKNTAKSDFIPKNNLPDGYTYSTTHDTQVSINGLGLSATEGLYKYKDGYADIDGIKNDNPKSLIDQYKLRYKNATYNPFKQIQFNGHDATLVTDYSIKNGEQIPSYTIIWNNNNYMFIVYNEEPTDSQTVLNLASATKN